MQGAAYFPAGIAPVWRQAWPKNVQLLPEPIHLQKALAEADAMICHAGATIAPALLAGKPLLLLPMQPEQFLTAQCVSKMGAAITLAPELQPVNWAGALHEIVHGRSYMDQARAFAGKYSDFDGERQAMTERSAALL